MNKIMNKILIVLIFLSSIPLSYAETGIFSNNEETTYNAVAYPNSASNNNFPILWDSLKIDTADFNAIYSFHLHGMGKITYAKTGSYTTFTCVSNCVGSGVFGYSRASDEITYQFNSFTTFTGSPINLTFAAPIQNDLSLQPWQSQGDLSITYPISVYVPGDFGITGLQRLGTVLTSMQFDAILAKTYSTNYTVTYIGNGLFNMSVTKIGGINQKIAAQNYSYNNYFIEDSYNTNPYWNTAYYGNGLYLNVSTTTGTHRLLINSTNIPSDPTPPLHSYFSGDWKINVSKVGANWNFFVYADDALGYFYMITPANQNKFATYITNHTWQNFTLSNDDLINAGGEGIWTAAIFNATDLSFSKAYFQFLVNNITTLSYSSTPTGAIVYINGQQSGITPFTIDSNNVQDITSVFKKTGYLDATIIGHYSTSTSIHADMIVDNGNGVAIDTTTESNNVIVALVVIFVGAIIGFKYAKIYGSIVGSVCGFIFAMAFGWLPEWIYLLIIAFAAIGIMIKVR